MSCSTYVGVRVRIRVQLASTSVDLYLINDMFLYVNIKHNFTCVRTESYNLHGGTGTSLYTPSLEYIF